MVDTARDRQRRRKEAIRREREERREEEERQRQLRLQGKASSSASASAASASGSAGGRVSGSGNSGAFRSSSTAARASSSSSSSSLTADELRRARAQQIRKEREEREKRKKAVQIQASFLSQHPEMAHLFEDSGSPPKPPRIPRPAVRRDRSSSSEEGPASSSGRGGGRRGTVAAAAAAAAPRKKAGGWTSKSDFGARGRAKRTDDRTTVGASGKIRSRGGAAGTATGRSSSRSGGRGGGVPMKVDLSGGSSSSSGGGRSGGRDRYSARLNEPSPLDEPSLSPPPSPGKKRKVASTTSQRPYSSSYGGGGAAAAAAAAASTRGYGATASYSRPSPPIQNKMGSLPPSRPASRRYDDSSDSDEYKEYARQGDEARRKKREAEEAAAAAAAEEARLKSKKKRAYSDSSSSDDDGAAGGRNGNNGKKTVSSPAESKTNQVVKKKKDRSSGSSSDSDGELLAHLNKTKRDMEARRPHNPLALQRMEEERYSSLARAKSAKTQEHRRRVGKKKGGSGNESDDDSIADAGGAAKAAAAKEEDDDDGFFSDAEQFGPDGGNESSDDDLKKKKKRAKSSPRGMKRGASSSSSSRAKSTGPRSKSSSSSTGAKKKPPNRKKKSKTEDEDEKVGYNVDMEELSDEEEDLENRLKPDFATPKFVVGALEPLEMTVTNLGKAQTTDRCIIESDIEVTRHYVPASINRYLQPYQREGIQFMHRVITDQRIPRGCILGDDMGLGKTVQIIGLLAAIQKKGGNDLDLKLLQQKRRRIAQELEDMQKREENALMQGLPIPSSNKEELFADAKKYGRILVVVPASVVANWQNEFKAWGHFGVAVYEGQGRRDALERVRDGRDEILVIGKPLFTKKGTDFPQINQLEWRLVICDEMHEYKGHRTNGHKCLEDLRNKSKCPVIGLTGTLIQNNYEELHTLITLVQPGLIGEKKTFMDQTGKPLMNMRSKTATPAVIARGEKRKAELDKAMKMVYLHRKKSEVLKDELTEKMQRVIFCELSDLQKRLYRHVLSLPDYHLLRTANTPCDCGVNQAFFLEFRRLKTTKEKLEYQRRKQKEVVLRKAHCYQIPHNPDRFDPSKSPIDPRAAIWSSQHDGAEPCDKCPSCVFLPALTKLYKICSHPSLLQADQDLSTVHRGSAEYVKTKKVLDFAKVAIPPDILAELPGKSYVRDAGLMDDHLGLSGKMEVLDYCLHKFNQRSDRVLIFSYSTKTLDLIENCVKAHGYKFLRLDGSTSTKKRQTLVDKFQNEDSHKAFLISTKAGGLGLNLTAANKVIIFDVNWNPSYDEQAQDRAFRIGQQRDVEVIRLVSQGTVEELMYARQLYKVHLKQQALGGKGKEEEAARLFRGVVGDKNRKGELFGIENLLKFKDGSFMDDIWSSRKGKKGKHAAANEEDIASALSNAGGVDGVLNMGSTNDEAEVQMLEEAAASENRRMSNGVNHEDFLSKHRGGATIDQDDEGFEEEMGGASQMNYAVYEEGGGEDDEDDGEEKKDDDEEDGKKPAAKLSPVAEQRVKDEPDVEEVQPSDASPQRGIGVSSDSGGGVASPATPAPTAAATAASPQAKKSSSTARNEREAKPSEAVGAAQSEGNVPPEPMEEDSPIAEVAASIMIINDAKKASKKKGGSPSKLSGLLHKPSYKKKKKKKKRDP